MPAPITIAPTWQFDDDVSPGEFPEGTARDGYSLVLQSFELNLDRAWDYNMFMVLAYRPAMMERGWRLLAAGSQLTGVPGRVVHLWHRGEPLRTPGAYSRASLAKQLADFTVREEVMVLRPTGYDTRRRFVDPSAPETPRPSDGVGPRGGSRVYLIDRIRVQPSRMTAFVEAKRALMFPLLAQPSPGRTSPWTLMGSGWARGAGAPLAVNVWELPDCDALLNTMRRVSENTTYQRFVRGCLEDGGEDQDLLAPMDFYEPDFARVGIADPEMVYRG